MKQCQIWINLQLTLALRTPHYYRHLATANKSQPLGKSMKKRNKFPLKQTLPFTEMWTLASTPARRFSCFFSRYNRQFMLHPKSWQTYYKATLWKRKIKKPFFKRVWTWEFPACGPIFFSLVRPRQKLYRLFAITDAKSPR